ncbi:MAG: signal recognition particle protein [Blautia sp.]|uniref:signal recognition particle protein n=1 Tax=Blautia sp. OF03-15BH TaxID=2292287 RepID=UPI000821BB28|nr:signal recognition particle protein [Blautia sp. OF03-15BH]MCI5859108.1 signal recognition particle protein [Blautia sp.]MDY2898804.1 signal recognition particle protein [Candidatus Limivivens sp.]RGY02295.1 signal recognition particle protein [Blautia sp. OF03-15BH]SCG87015.1 Fifty-four homolog [uncultured Clostridium sp.]
MAFESLSEKLQNVFKNLRSKGRLTEADVKTALKEVKLALLEADVSFKVVKQFVKNVQERAVGQDVMNGLNPGQMVIKIVNEELVNLMGSETTEIALKPASEITVIMMAGLQGAGKTTTTAKIAAKLKSKGRKPLLAACDVYRPAAIRQLEINGEKVGVEVFSMGDRQNPVDIAKAAVEHARNHGHNVVILDTAGRLHVDESMMEELEKIKAAVDVYQTILVVDAMTGQDAVNVSDTFNQKVGIDGVILTKLDGDTRGGAALSIKATCGKPILYVGMGEKLSDLEQFYPDRMASRILGMGDVMSLIEKAQANIDEEKARSMEQKLKKAQFGFDDYLESMEQMKNMGGMRKLLEMLPGMGGSQLKQIEDAMDEKKMAQIEAMILSMTPKERANPDLLNPSRKKRIAAGAGVDISEVNKLVKQFDQSRKMMKQMGGMMNSKSAKRGKFRLPF